MRERLATLLIGERLEMLYALHERTLAIRDGNSRLPKPSK